MALRLDYASGSDGTVTVHLTDPRNETAIAYIPMGRSDALAVAANILTHSGITEAVFSDGVFSVVRSEP